MATKKEQKAPSTSGAQLDLIDVTPEYLAEIKPVARRYRAALRARLDALEEETAAKQELLSLIKASNPSRLPDGSIRFRCDGYLISVTPRDELVKVKDEEDAQGD